MNQKKVKRLLLGGETVIAIKPNVTRYFGKYTPDELCEDLEYVKQGLGGNLPPALEHFYKEALRIKDIAEEQSLLYMLQRSLSKKRIEFYKEGTSIRLDAEGKLVTVSDLTEQEQEWADALCNFGYYFDAGEDLHLE